MGILWDSTPPTAQDSCYRILSALNSRDITMIVLGDPVGVWVHFRDGRSFPCLGDGCDDHQAPIHKKAYLPVMAWVMKEPGAWGWERRVFELSPEAWREWNPAWLGKAVKARRKGENKRGPVKVQEVTLNLEPPSDLETFDVTNSLLRVWGMLNRPALASSPKTPEPILQFTVKQA